MKPIDAKIPKHVEPIGQGSFGVDSQPLTNSRLADVAIAPEEEDLFFYKVLGGAVPPVPTHNGLRP